MFFACGSENSGLVGYSYHNITAKYNAYFIAREKLQEVTERIEESYEPNFNKVLLVFPPIDTNIVKSDSALIADVIKKASIAIQRHEVSKWVDDSYILVGRARFLNRSYEEAIETFKYVNVKSENKQTQYASLIHLIRTFIDYGEFANAQAVIDYLSRKKLNNTNKVEFYLHAANYAQHTNDPNNLIKYLNAAVEIMPGGREKSKYHFILAQLFQKAGFDAVAYDNYEKTIQNNPSYNFYFHARLNMAQVTELSDGSDLKKIRKYFEQLLEDGKNVEFKDKIYYEMGEFEKKQKNLPQAIEYYKSSVSSSVSNQRQKSFAYHKLGLLYFEDLNEYALAKAYYDSASKIMPRDEEIYDRVAKRQQILSVFVQQINTISTNDSLIALSKMDSSALNKIFEEQREARISAEKEKEKKKRKEERNKANQELLQQFGGNNFNTVTSTNGKFYFYDAATVANGKNQFKRTWGNRSIQDNWRFESGQNRVRDALAENDISQDQTTEAPQLSEEDQVLQERTAFFASIPKAESRIDELKQEIEVALYKLGNIYNFDLDVKAKALETYKRLLERFPSSQYKPEVLYLLYVYHKDSDAELAKGYADELTTKFPETIFAKLVINPNYQEESNLASAKVKIIYEKAYLAYEERDFDTALQLINDGLDNYPENDYEDNLVLLNALIVGETEDKSNYIYKLQQFLKEYSESELSDFAKTLLAAVESLEQKLRELRQIQYIPYFEQSHYFVLLYEKNEALSSILPQEITNFSKEYFPEQSLNAGNLIFNDQYAMILLSEFKTRELAEAFYLKFNGELSPLKNFQSLKFESYIISKDNFQIFYQSKMADSYNDFFQNNYKLNP